MNRERLLTAFKFGAVTGLIIAAIIAGIMTVREWMLNPGGIYHDASGTNWRFVVETYWSWFLPFLAVTAGIGMVVRWLFSRRRGGEGAS